MVVVLQWYPAPGSWCTTSPPSASKCVHVEGLRVCVLPAVKEASVVAAVVRVAVEKNR